MPLDSTGHPPLWMSGRNRMSGIPRDIAPPAATDQNQIAAAFTRWRDSLESVRRSIDEATAAVGLLRATLKEMAPLWQSLEQLEQALTASDLAGAMDQAAAAAQEVVAKSAGLAARPAASSEHLAAPGQEESEDEAPWSESPAPADERRLRRAELAAPEQEESEDEVPWSESPAPADERRSRRAVDIPTLGAGSPYAYTITVEDVGAKVKLVPLHQALSQVEGVRELSLKSYANGVAIVSVDSEVELEAPVLQEAISAGMNKACRITAGEGASFMVRMSSQAASGEQRQRALTR